ncbi:MAG TPA: dTDP-4-amino-4,6-dideoxygalactose transaminase [Solirubrobacteraceae bacterium]|jgi:dTDP-4-amino-4,6-dideoxygalactose transaminase|nr:dTDP-4-amino-4,6-dideoxygalactose transaminase [Solirubrobacteraceae bacterium]
METAVDGVPSTKIPFNRPHTTGDEFGYIQEAIDNLHLSGNGPFTERCSRWLEQQLGTARVLLTCSCSSALEMAMLVADIGPRDEVIVPSYTFPTTAGAVALRGAVPVFVDICADTLNLDERLIEEAVSPRTRAIVPVHYAGVSCAMDAIVDIAERHELTVIEDAAQGISAAYRNQPLGAIGDLGCLSFHETKNLTCGEGGALLVNRPDWIERAEILQEKGTNRSQFLRGQVDKYTWVDLGSSFLTSEINAAFLWAQIQHSAEILERRMAIWNSYHERFAALEQQGLLRRPTIPADRTHNAHMYYLLLPTRAERDRFIERLAARRVEGHFHYIPLHSSTAGRRYGRAARELPVTDRISDTLVRLPLFLGMSTGDVERVCLAVEDAVRHVGAPRRPRPCSGRQARVPAARRVVGRRAGKASL